MGKKQPKREEDLRGNAWREDVGHLEVDISDLAARGETSEGGGRSVCHSKKGTWGEGSEVGRGGENGRVTLW